MDQAAQVASAARDADHRASAARVELVARAKVPAALEALGASAEQAKVPEALADREVLVKD